MKLDLQFLIISRNISDLGHPTTQYSKYSLVGHTSLAQKGTAVEHKPGQAQEKYLCGTDSVGGPPQARTHTYDTIECGAASL